MKKSPLQIVKEKFGTEDRKEAKTKLVEAVRKLASGDLWIDRVSGKGLERISNQKLLHLHDVLGKVKDEFGSRSKLIAAIVKAEGREKDKDYANRYNKMPTPRLWDAYQSVSKKLKKSA